MTRQDLMLNARRRVMRLLAALGLYRKFASSDGRYYYVTGPLLPFPRFCVIAESLEHSRDRWTRDWISGEPAAVLWFSFWKLKLRQESRATWQEVDWFYGFQVVAAARSDQRSKESAR